MARDDARKSTTGRYFEDFTLDQCIDHASPRTITEGDVALYHALTGNKFTLQASNQFARNAGYHAAPVDDLFVFNAVFGLSVADISINAKANLGYAGCDFLSQLSVGETLRARSTVIGLRETSKGDMGIVYVKTEGLDHRDIPILEFVRWVMVPKRDPSWTLEQTHVPDLPDSVRPITVPRHRLNRDWNDAATGSPHRWDDYNAGEKIDHIDGVTIEDAEHQMLTRLFQNGARVHFNDHVMRETPFGKRLVYGGFIMSVARALSHNGLANACIVSAINGAKHAAPSFGGDTIYAWTEVLEKNALDGRDDIGALRLRTRAVKNRPCSDFPEEGPDIVLDWDYTVILPRR